MPDVPDSILDTTKLLLGIEPDDDSYDVELITHINSMFFVLQQLGVGPVTGFAITDNTQVWSEFIEEELINGVKTYMGMRVKLLFDTPATGPLTTALENQVAQMEWRLNMQMEVKKNAGNSE